MPWPQRTSSSCNFAPSTVNRGPHNDESRDLCKGLDRRTGSARHYRFAARAAGRGGTELLRRRKNKTRCAVVWDTPPARIDADTVGLTGLGHIEVVANNPLPDAPLAEVWQAVDTFTSDPRARNMRLPALKGAPRRKEPWGNW